MSELEQSQSLSMAATAFARPQVVWPDSVGARYRFECFPPHTPWVRLPAVYVLARTAAHGAWVPLYVGEADNLREHMASLPVRSAAQRQGMDAVHVHFFTGPGDQRRALARALIKTLAPPLNERGQADDNVGPTRHRSSVISRMD
jgi:hypothetical protein